MSLALPLLLFAAVQGLLAGSFLNVCIVRLPRQQSLMTPRSRCMHCRHKVRWFDNVPLLSFALLRGRCRDCSGRIRWQYPLVELAMGCWFALCALPFVHRLAAGDFSSDALLQSFAHCASLCALGFLLLGLGVMDWQTGLLPNEFTIGGVCLGIFFAFVESFFLPSVPYKTFLTPEEFFIFQRVGASMAAALLLWGIGALYRLVRGRNGLGGGDIKMLALLGAFLGYAGTLLGFLLGVGLAAAAGVTLLAMRRGTGATRLPFGTYLAVGGGIAALVGPRIVTWYLGFFR